MCYDNVRLTQPIGGMPIGTKCDEVLVNMRTMRLKFNTGDDIVIVQFNFDISEESLIVRKDNEPDSDFEEEEEEGEADDEDTSDEDTSDEDTSENKN